MTSKDFGVREGELAVELPAKTDAGLYYIGRIRTLSRLVAQAYYDSREALGFPMAKIGGKK